MGQNISWCKGLFSVGGRTEIYIQSWLSVAAGSIPGIRNTEEPNWLPDN